MTAKTSEKLALVLESAGLTNLADKARKDLYHDFLSPSATPCMDLVNDLAMIAPRSSVAQDIRQRAMDGEFDASTEEGEEWANSPDGKATFSELLGEH